MSEKKADIFLTYCTNAVLAKKDTASFEIVEIPAMLAVGADYGMIVLKDASEGAVALADFILGPDAQNILRDYGFGARDDSSKSEDAVAASGKSKTPPLARTRVASFISSQEISEPRSLHAEDHFACLDDRRYRAADLEAQFLYGIYGHGRGDDIAAADIDLDLGGDGAFLDVLHRSLEDIARAELHGSFPILSDVGGDIATVRRDLKGQPRASLADRAVKPRNLVRKPCCLRKASRSSPGRHRRY